MHADMGFYPLLVIDQAPLFEEALGQCQLARKKIEGLKSTLYLYDTRDLPAYERWFHATFGKYITLIRDLSATIEVKERTVASTKRRHWAGFFDCASEMQEQSLDEEDLEDLHLHDEDPESHARRESRPQADEDILEDEDVESEYGPQSENSRYQESDSSSVYDDEEDYHFSENSESASRFEKTYFRGSSRNSSGFRRRSRSSFDRSEGSTQNGFSAGSNGSKRIAAVEPQALLTRENRRTRIKDRYRILVRMLHPDQNPDLTAEEKDLWNQVQTAYQKDDLEQLDLLIVLSDAFSGKASTTSSLHQLLRAREEIERLISSLRRKLHHAMKNRAWNFALLQEKAPLERGIEKELQRELAALKEHDEHLDFQLNRFRPAPRSSQASSQYTDLRP